MSGSVHASTTASSRQRDAITGCPICEEPAAERLLALPCGGIDGSTLYPTVELVACRACGHSYNLLTPDELEGLGRYYNEEYAPANLSAGGLAGDRPGSGSALTSTRYAQLWSALSPFVEQHHAVLDVGCALGGFLELLRSQGLTHLAGVDMTETYVAEARRSTPHRIELGNAEALPFEDESFDALVIEQVLEHLVHPLRAFEEARRVLRPGGILCIGVPDAARYQEAPFFDYYWLLLREHIQHFDARHLALLAARAGFDLCDVRYTTHAVMSEQMQMPNLYGVFRKRELQLLGPERSALTDGMTDYLRQEGERADARKHLFAELAKSRRPVYAWGIGREFLSLYASAGLSACNLVGLVDSNPLKQRAWSVGGLRVTAPQATLGEAPPDALLLVTAVAHTAPISAAARRCGFQGELVSFGDMRCRAGVRSG